MITGLKPLIHAVQCSISSENFILFKYNNFQIGTLIIKTLKRKSEAGAGKGHATNVHQFHERFDEFESRLQKSQRPQLTANEGGPGRGHTDRRPAKAESANLGRKSSCKFLSKVQACAQQSLLCPVSAHGMAKVAFSSILAFMKEGRCSVKSCGKPRARLICRVFT